MLLTRYYRIPPRTLTSAFRCRASCHLRIILRLFALFRGDTLCACAYALDILRFVRFAAACCARSNNISRGGATTARHLVLSSRACFA